ncbi:hypothetical protein GCM10009554_45310 [Kribbella koreensis]|uniref:Uncharacterized protein n=1 Tax=Kribbella koreensis TaxID=57909 RepID=A0ABN1QVG7_9ACTN
MAGWESLREDLRRLYAESPDALMSGPDPDSERSETRIHIELDAWATEIAATLHTKYGELVDLRVGAMTFPAGEFWLGERWDQLYGVPVEPTRFEVDSAAPLSVRSGRTSRREVLVTNRAAYPQVLSSNGELSSVVTDDSGNVVGRFVGPQPLSLMGFEIAPHQTRSLPVLIGTASVVPDLPYAVPPGQWELIIELQVGGESLLSAPLDLTITP